MNDGQEIKKPLASFYCSIPGSRFIDKHGESHYFVEGVLDVFGQDLVDELNKVADGLGCPITAKKTAARMGDLTQTGATTDQNAKVSTDADPVQKALAQIASGNAATGVLNSQQKSH